MKKWLIFPLILGMFGSVSFAKSKINFIVGVDGNFKEALDAASKKPGSAKEPFVIFFPNGEHNIGVLGDANQMFTFNHSNVALIGENAEKTILFNKSTTEGISITATLATNGNDVYMQDLTVENRATVDPNASANRFVAVMQKGDRHVYKNVRLNATQDTYYTNSSGRTYYEGGHIEGTVDFICGNGDVYFQGVHLLQKRAKGYITAAKTTTTWGYVFNEAVIDGSNGAAGTYYLGRSWGTAKTVFLNSKMNAEPTAQGWGEPMNSVPQVFAEYNSRNANGGAINLSNRKKTYTKDGTTVNLNPVLSESEAAQYSIANVLGGSDKWSPAELTRQVNAPQITQNGGTIIWDDNSNARYYAIFKNGNYFDNTTDAFYLTNGLNEGDKITVRAANAMGGLGASSNEITLSSAPATPLIEMQIKEPWGGSISANPGFKIPEGSGVTFTAEPALGWKFVEWLGDAIGKSPTISFENVNMPLIISAKFEPIDPFVYEAETGSLLNAVYEDKNAGFSGNSYINFGADDASADSIPIEISTAGIYQVQMIYANGSTAARSLKIKSSVSETEYEFNTTASWTTWENATVELSLDSGQSFLIFENIGNNDGPNLDKIELKLLKPLDEIKDGIKKLNFAKEFSPRIVPVYSIVGKEIKKVWLNSLDEFQNTNLPLGMYLLKINQKFYRITKER